MINDLSIMNNSFCATNSTSYRAKITSKNIDKEFSQSIFTQFQNLKNSTPKIREALKKIDNIVVLKSAQSDTPDELSDVKRCIQGEANIAYGFVSKPDKAVVIIQDNHKRKNEALEGEMNTQGEDTLNHEIGHLVDDGLSSSSEFKSAYLKDLKRIEKMLKECPDLRFQGMTLNEILEYEKHYFEGSDFSRGISENDVTRRGLRENFAECFSTITDNHPSKINEIFAFLFPNTMQKTFEFVA